MRRVASIAFACVFTVGCTSKDKIASGALTAFSQSTSADTIRLPTKTGSVVEFGPNATLRIVSAHDTTELPASSLYSNEWGLFQKNGDPIGAWDELDTIEVEQFDGAATVAVSACAAVAIIALAALLKSAPSASGSKGSSGGGGGGGKAPPVRSAPNAPTSGSAVNPAVSELVFRTAEALANGATQNGTAVVVATSTDLDEVATAIPLFSRGARRRANVRFLARVEGGACWPGGGGSADCITSGARLGLRLLDFIELTAGARVETNQTRNVSVPLATLGAMLHGESPSAHWFAIALGASVAFDGTRAHVVPQFSVRFRPLRGLWLGLVPVEPIYASETATWSMASGIEITGEL